jgi:hypothetical protein
MPLDALNKLAKWRSVFASWQLGTRPHDDPECQAVRDHREVTMLLRAEVNALTMLLLKHGVFTEEELKTQVDDEAEHLNAKYEKRFPGFTATATGMTVDLALAKETVKGWRS